MAAHMGDVTLKLAESVKSCKYAFSLKAESRKPTKKTSHSKKRKMPDGPQAVQETDGEKIYRKNLDLGEELVGTAQQSHVLCFKNTGDLKDKTTYESST